nr:SUMF1/EgtB/PvdO family nonheme iron enzyme [Kiritimatiellia bacterium]
MGWMQTCRWVPAALLLLAAGGMTAVRAEEFAIQSFDGTGRLIFNKVSTAETYRVEWAPSPDGPWTNFSAAALALDKIVATGSGIVTCSVPMCYRVVATVTNAAPFVPSGMVLIPGGTNSGTDPDFGAYSLTVGSFYMDKFEVTKTKWDEVYTWAITNGYNFDNDLYGEGLHGQGKAPNHPVHTVNWYDTVKWCNARSQKEGRPAVYTMDGAVYKAGQSDNVVQSSAAGYRLPTDVEWEYAARGGVANRRFPWSDSDTIQHARANYYSSSSYSYDTSPTRDYHPTYATGGYPYTSPVGSFAANGYDLHDMSGNVWEWCFDWYPGYEGSLRVLRGGSWDFSAYSCRVGERNDHPGNTIYYCGFRTVLPPGQE